MKYLAIDTSGKHLTVLAYNGERLITVYERDCALKHSVLVMDKIDEALSRANLTPNECDFFAAVVGPGSFTGIRIGIATVKGLCMACGKPAVAVTSFDCIAYAKEWERVLALVDAGHGYVYACPYEKGVPVKTPCYSSKEEAQTAYGEVPFAAAEPVPMQYEEVNPAEGLFRAIENKPKISAEALTALYIRRSSAEENR